MSYYFAIIGTQDNPLFEHEFGTSKQGNDGLSRFTDQARHLNQFILHAALDVVQEVQWTGAIPPLSSSSSASSSSIFSSSASSSAAGGAASSLAALTSSSSASSHSAGYAYASTAGSVNNGQMYLKVIDKFFNNYISCFITGANVKFLLLHQPTGSGVGAGAVSGSSSSSIMAGTGTGVLGGGGSRSSTSIAANPTSAATEEAIKNFFTEVYENWVKAIMSPFYKVNMEVRSPIFRQRVVAAGKKYL
ncbi:Sedlin [Coniella lustricola]|uniref:Sedlin n=1 Tax=Coniella lustricola TaxID=2025994 RepID=A0A2T2ZWX3_9PEZI|nr:Sedlin [Coniella lustricola]